MDIKQSGINVRQLDKAMEINEADSTGIAWYSPMESPFRLSGFPWIAVDRVYRRLPLNINPGVPEIVSILANCTAGGQVSFRTNSRKLVLKVELAGVANMCHMPATGQCGFDCYLGEPGKRFFYSATKYDHSKSTYECTLFDFPNREVREVLLNFPLYQGVKSVFVGLDSDAEIFEPTPFAIDKPVVIYGTSITQGGCASRPGMAYTNILSRNLNVPVVNLGFSGNGKGDPGVAEIIAGIPELACVVLDYEANATADGLLEKTLAKFFGIIREKHPTVPILIVSKIRYAIMNFSEEALNRANYLRDFQRSFVEEQRKQGDANVHFLDGSTLLGDKFDECTVDGVHPTDLGFARMAENLEPVLRDLIF